MKIRDNETGEVFEYGIDRHHALRISRNGGCLTFENLQNGDGSLESGDGGYSFVLDDGKTPEESVSPDAVNGSTYANIGGFHEENSMNDGWIPVEERLPEVFGKYWATIRYDDGRISEPIVVDFRGVREKYVVDTPNGREYETWGIDSAFHGSRVIAWRPYYIPKPYRPERSEGE